MAKKSESRFAPELRALGFIPIDEEITLSTRELIRGPLTRNERRLLRKKRYRPWFTIANLVTFATDETGLSWKGPPNVDLAHLGFDDNTQLHKTLLKKMHESDKGLN